MPAITNHTHLLPVDGGQVEALVDLPSSPRALALVAHPHPLMGGDARHKVPFSLARTLNRAGVATWRPNFRGVGASTGRHDLGEGETDDLLAVLALMREAYPDLPVLLAGFSFGAYVITRVAARCRAQQLPYLDAILCGLPHGEIKGHRHYDSPRLPAALLVHGELDRNVPLEQPLAWAAEAGVAVSVVPAADHFFSGKLDLLASLVADRVALKLSPPAR